MEENKKPKYLEELEETSTEKLDRYGLTPIQRKQYEKDKKLDKLKTKLPIYLWLLVGIITGILLFLSKPYLSLDKTQIKTMSIPVCIIAGICWWIIPLLIFKNKLTNKFTKIIDNKKAKSTIKYELLPFTTPKGSPKGSNHKDFIRCPLCGHKLKQIENFSNGEKIYEYKFFVEKDQYGNTISAPYESIVPASPLEEHTSYKCSHCNFSFKASYKGEYHFNSKYTGMSCNTIIHTNNITPLSKDVKMDEEAENILKPYVNTKTTKIFN